MPTILRTPARSVVALGIAAVLGLAACGDDTPTAAGSPTAAGAPAGGGTTAAPVSPYGGVDAGATGGGSTGGATEGAATLGTATSDLGTFLVDAGGNTLYVFMPDARGASTCTGDCAGAWPALAGPAEAGDGVDASLVGTATRPDDGSEQVTYDGWPLYTFSGDAAAGDTNGQGLGGNWFVLAPDGTPITG